MIQPDLSFPERMSNNLHTLRQKFFDHSIEEEVTETTKAIAYSHFSSEPQQMQKQVNELKVAKKLEKLADEFKMQMKSLLDIMSQEAKKEPSSFTPDFTKFLRDIIKLQESAATFHQGLCALEHSGVPHEEAKKISEEFMAEIKKEFESLAKFALDMDSCRVQFSDSCKSNLHQGELLLTIQRCTGKKIDLIQKLKDQLFRQLKSQLEKKHPFQRDFFFECFYEDYVFGKEWIKNNQSLDESTIQADSLAKLTRLARAFHAKELEEKCLALITTHIKELMDFQPKEECVNGAKWLAMAELSVQLDLPNLKETCIQAMPYIKCDPSTPKGAKELLNIEVFILKNKFPDEVLFHPKGKYPPVNLLAEGSNEPIPIPLPIFLFFCPLFTNFYSCDEHDLNILSSLSPEQAKAVSHWMIERVIGKTQTVIITKENWKELITFAHKWDIKELQEECEIVVWQNYKTRIEIKDFSILEIIDPSLYKAMSIYIDHKGNFERNNWNICAYRCQTMPFKDNEYTLNTLSWIKKELTLDLQRYDLNITDEQLPLFTSLPLENFNLSASDNLTSAGVQKFLQSFFENNPKQPCIRINFPSSLWNVLQEDRKLHYRPRDYLQIVSYPKAGIVQVNFIRDYHLPNLG